MLLSCLDTNSIFHFLRTINNRLNELKIFQMSDPLLIYLKSTREFKSLVCSMHGENKQVDMQSVIA